MRILPDRKFCAQIAAGDVCIFERKVVRQH